MNKLTLNGTEVLVGQWLEHPFEHGCVLNINFDTHEVDVYDGREGWTLSEAHDNLGDLKFE